MLSRLFANLCTANPLLRALSRTHTFRGYLADISNEDSRLSVDILVGSDYYWDLVTGSICRSLKRPTAVYTKLGWVLSSPTLSIESVQCSVNLTTTHVLRIDTHQGETSSLDEQLRSFWELELLGIHVVEKTLLDDFAGSVRFQDGRYKVSLPWKEFYSTQPDNYQLIIEAVPVGEATCKRIHHLPHHAVVRRDKPTTKLRIVYMTLLLDLMTALP